MAAQQDESKMKSVSVTSLMIPLSDYATVSQDATLYEAVCALKEASKKLETDKHAHRAVLVLNEVNQVVGKLSQWDVLRGLERPFKELTNFNHTRAFGFSASYVKTIANDLRNWKRPLEQLYPRVAKVKVKDVMYTPTEGEFVREDATIDEAIYQLAMGRHQSLLVVNDVEVVGVLRLVDVFEFVCKKIEKAGEKHK
ncbi:MAG: CBS domain-containing protein [Deltaproteobacteria bacterium]|nr:CBS domain-containing protein [Deltaproteobacteria bacterium]